jgi:hypothetical protein
VLGPEEGEGWEWVISGGAGGRGGREMVGGVLLKVWLLLMGLTGDCVRWIGCGGFSVSVGWEGGDGRDRGGGGLVGRLFPRSREKEFRKNLELPLPVDLWPVVGLASALFAAGLEVEAFGITEGMPGAVAAVRLSPLGRLVECASPPGFLSAAKAAASAAAPGGSGSWDALRSYARL